MNHLDDMIALALRHHGTELALPRVGFGVLHRHSAPTTSMCGAGVCLVLQGAKRMLVGSKVVRYRRGQCFASLIELPASKCTFEIADGKPYVATYMTFEPEVFADVVGELTRTSVKAFSVARASDEVVEAWSRYLALLDHPSDAPTLAPLRERELIYRLLQSPHGPMLRQIVQTSSRLGQIRRTITWLRTHYAEQVSAKKLARLAGMSVPSLHRHFRAATAMSPLQYQKRIRLQAARRLLANDSDAASAAYAVGYESASQFSREYARLFGRPPRQDAAHLRDAMIDLGHASL